MKIKKSYILLALLVVGIFFSYHQNNFITVTRMTLEPQQLPQGFDGFKIVHLSDLHDKTFGEEQHRLVSKVRAAKPDIIVFTGDLIDGRKHDEKPALILMKELVKIAPVYYVIGNHEVYTGKISLLEEEMEKLGMEFLRNSAASFQRNGDKIDILGIDDPIANTRQAYKRGSFVAGCMERALEQSSEDSFKILLSHRPELLSIYAEYNIDLIFTGHAHGGQVRLPFIGGLIAPEQGFFPKYTAGKHGEGKLTMIISRGLGNSIVPQRIFNRPQVIVVTLRKSDVN
jgi:uncharacterized protein